MARKIRKRIIRESAAALPLEHALSRNGRPVMIELHEDAIVFRLKRCRRRYVLSLADAMEYAILRSAEHEMHLIMAMEESASRTIKAAKLLKA